MIFRTTQIAGVRLVDLEPVADNRGFFARAWCREEFARQGICLEIVQANLIHSLERGTLRGLHYQAPPHEEDKLVRCIRGAAFVVVADLRRESRSCGQWCGVELSAENRSMLYVPKGCAQGYQTLAGDTEMYYLMSAAYHPESARGLRYDDPAFGMRWPLPVGVISERDRSWPDYAQ